MFPKIFLGCLVNVTASMMRVMVSLEGQPSAHSEVAVMLPALHMLSRTRFPPNLRVGLN